MINYLININILNLDYLNFHKENALMIAIILGYEEVVKLLIKYFDINQVNCFGNNIFTLACFYNRNEIVKFLLNYKDKLNINLINKFKSNAFTLACKKNNINIINILLETNIDKDLYDIKNINSWTYLYKNNYDSEIFNDLRLNFNKIDIKNKILPSFYQSKNKNHLLLIYAVNNDIVNLKKLLAIKKIFS